MMEVAGGNRCSPITCAQKGWAVGTPISHIRPIAKGKTPPWPREGGSEFYTPMGDCFSLACENLPNSKTISIRTAGVLAISKGGIVLFVYCSYSILFLALPRYLDP